MKTYSDELEYKKDFYPKRTERELKEKMLQSEDSKCKMNRSTFDTRIRSQIIEMIIQEHTNA